MWIEIDIDIMAEAGKSYQLEELTFWTTLRVARWQSKCKPQPATSIYATLLLS